MGTEAYLVAEQAKAKFWLGRHSNLRCIADAVDADEGDLPFADAFGLFAEGKRLDSMQLRDAAVTLATWSKSASKQPQDEDWGDAEHGLQMALLFASLARKHVCDTFRLYKDCNDKDAAADFRDTEDAGPSLSDIINLRDTLGVCPICL